MNSLSKQMDLIVQKFGGASVNSAEAVKNVENILSNQKFKRLVVISAMGKSTNNLEKIVNHFYQTKQLDSQAYDFLLSYHLNIVEGLFEKEDNNLTLIKEKINDIFSLLKQKLIASKNSDYDLLYDTIVPFGERLSTFIISFYLNSKQINNTLLSSQKIIITDNNYRDANVNLSLTKSKVINDVLPLFDKQDLIITQGFVGGIDNSDQTTTLSREGSDYTAGILSYCSKANKMIIWKDVPCMLNADPKRMKHTTPILSMPYQEAIELSYYGATIIHPKTIKPLQNSKTPLYIKSFVCPTEPGTVICEQTNIVPLVPNYIFKDNQILISVSPKNFSFAIENYISKAFDILALHKVKANLIQNSAISFSLCFDKNDNIFNELINDLKHEFNVLYNKDLELITIRHYNQKDIDTISHSDKIIICQQTRTTIQLLVKEEDFLQQNL